MGVVTLRKGREFSLLRRHPWVFSGAVANVRDIKSNGETVEVISQEGQKLGMGAVSLHSQIKVRMWSYAEEEINNDFIAGRIRQAAEKRNVCKLPGQTDACRLIFSESDGLPGLIVDRYAGFIVCQFLSAGAEYHKEAIVEAIEKEFQPDGMYERSDTRAREKEGLPLRSGLLRGKEPDDLVTVKEHGLEYLVDIKQGHKTGFYLDQRENRCLTSVYASGLQVLNCFSYTGAFGVAALKNGAASVTNIEASATANAIAEKNFALNGCDPAAYSIQEGDVFQTLRSYRDQGRQFDMIILDPPKFAESRIQVHGALRGYKDINLLAIKLLTKGGWLVTFSCSGHITPDMFFDVVRSAANDAERETQVLHKLQQAQDHPVMLGFPEGEYLKGLMCRIW